MPKKYILSALTSDIDVGAVFGVTFPGAQADFVQALMLLLDGPQRERAGAEGCLHLQTTRGSQGDA